MVKALPPRARYRQDLLISLIGIVVFGLLSKFYPGPGHNWINNSFGGIPYEIAWMLLVAWIWPTLSPITIAIAVFFATAALEVLQLWRTPWLQAIRATLLGRLILGNSFSFSDFPYYVLGCFLGWLWLRWLIRRSQMP